MLRSCGITTALEYRACASIGICNVTGAVIDALFLEFEINEFILLVMPGDIMPLGVKLWFKSGLVKFSLKLVSLL